MSIETDLNELKHCIAYLQRLYDLCMEQTPPPAPTKTLADLFEPHIGVKEYTGIVETIQRDYYGSLVKAAWCATAVSYFYKQLTGRTDIRAENVKIMLDQCRASSRFQSITGSRMQRGDIVFFLWDKSDTMSTTASKHVSIYTGTPDQYIGGNQDDMICIKTYPAESIYAIYRPLL